MQIKNSVFLVTGGASGLGAATARMAAEGGAKVVIADVQDGEAYAKEIGARYVKCDVTSEADGKAAVEAALKNFGGLHVLVNCAGIALAERTLGKEAPHDLARFARVINVNLVGTFNMIRLAADAMAKASPNASGERGVIVSTASVAAFDGQIGQAAYSASKGGIASLTLPIARDLSRNGIRVCTVAPGLFETPLLKGLPKEAQESLAKQVPFPSRLGRPGEYAQLVKAIVEIEMLNAETIRLDGAIRMAPK
ncbi:MAG TPA: 3-hydroxyacyl-CoA dehydrogenase [Burkholderiales bacterium]|jgi:NAD(P)-dependent dehydrogenase (short-subunit alcohol dehydrogenase family)|nr:3-hydroxyacyl-CoA dehydrogenase [Burkholderiales bacterium]